MTTHTNETQNETALRALCGGGENVLIEAVQALAKRDGTKTYEWLLSQWFCDKAAAPVKKVKAGWKNVEEPGDEKVTDADLLRILEETKTEVSAKDWFRRAHVLYGISKGGFYARINNMAAVGTVLMTEDKEPRTIYGRDVLATVKFYWAPQALKIADIGLYNELTK